MRISLMRMMWIAVFAGAAATACSTRYVNMGSRPGEALDPPATSGGSTSGGTSTDSGGSNGGSGTTSGSGTTGGDALTDGGPTQDAGSGTDGGVLGDGGAPTDGGPVLDAGICSGVVSDLSVETRYSGMNVYGTPYSYFVGASGDLNGDGLLDLVFVEFLAEDANAHDGGLDVFFGLPNGGLSAATSYAGSDGDSVAILDLNGDGNPDVVTSTAGGVNVFLNDGGGMLLAPVFSGTTNQVVGIAGGDLNGDGIADLVLAEQVNGLTGAEFLLGLGAGAFSSPVALPGQGSFFGRPGGGGPQR